MSSRSMRYFLLRNRARIKPTNIWTIRKCLIVSHGIGIISKKWLLKQTNEKDGKINMVIICSRQMQHITYSTGSHMNNQWTKSSPLIRGIIIPNLSGLHSLYWLNLTNKRSTIESNMYTHFSTLIVLSNLFSLFTIVVSSSTCKSLAIKHINNRRSHICLLRNGTTKLFFKCHEYQYFWH